MANTLSEILNKYRNNSQGLWTNFTTPLNYSPVNLNSVDSHLEAIDKTFKITRSGHTTNRQDLTSNFSLTNESEGIHNLLNSTANVLTISLPNPPIKDRHFIVKNRLNSSSALSINNITLQPGEMWNGIWDGVEWIEI